VRFWKIVSIVSALGVLIVATVYGILAASQETEELNPAIQKNALGNFIDLDGGKVHYVLTGSDTSELIVFLHGGGVTGMEVWKENIPYFKEQGFQVLAYDLYGRGYSDRPIVDYTPQLLERQLSDLIDRLNISKPFHIVTMSMGAMVALDYASKNPQRVKKIVLLDPALTGDFRPSALLKIPVVNKLLMTLYWYPRAVENQRKEFQDSALFEQYSLRLKYFMNFKGYKHVNYSTWMHTLRQNKIHLLDSYKPSSVLLLYGANDPYFPINNVEIYKSHYPTLKHESVPKAGHMPHLEQPKAVNELIHAFLTE
jgi:pimeloyl-ACP methyl ester carboxylesterase